MSTEQPTTDHAEHARELAIRSTEWTDAATEAIATNPASARVSARQAAALAVDAAEHLADAWHTLPMDDAAEHLAATAHLATHAAADLADLANLAADLAEEHAARALANLRVATEHAERITQGDGTATTAPRHAAAASARTRSATEAAAELAALAAELAESTRTAWRQWATHRARQYLAAPPVETMNAAAERADAAAEAADTYARAAALAALAALAVRALATK